MGSERCLRAAVAAAAALAVVAIAARPAGAAAASAWWTPLGLRGSAIIAVALRGGTIVVRTGAGRTMQSTDGGTSFSPVAGNPGLPPAGEVTAAGATWSIDATGRVLVSAGGRPATPDPHAPGLGAGADLIAAPAALPGAVIAVATDGTVWRRSQDGTWSRSLLLLPRSLVQGVPRVTAVTAFDAEPLSATVYLGSDGYAVLDSTDGGDDWIRAGPGLPDAVYSLTTDPARHAVYAGTADGLWVHVLQALPAPPVYQDAALAWRWVGIGAVTLTASVLAVVAMLLALRPRRPPAG